MVIRTHEVHPAIVHFPITLLPVAIGADLIGRVTGSRALTEVGRWAMPLTAATAALLRRHGARGAGRGQGRGPRARSARDASQHEPELRRALGSHGRLALEEPHAKRVVPRALALGSLGAVSYSAYLGSKMVYEYGVGVDAAHGLKRPEGAPEIAPGHLAEAARSAVQDAERGLPHIAESIRQGEIVPEITRNHTPLRREPGEGPGGYSASESIDGGDIRT